MLQVSSISPSWCALDSFGISSSSWQNHYLTFNNIFSTFGAFLQLGGPIKLGGPGQSAPIAPPPLLAPLHMPSKA